MYGFLINNGIILCYAHGQYGTSYHVTFPITFTRAPSIVNSSAGICAGCHYWSTPGFDLQANDSTAFHAWFAIGI